MVDVSPVISRNSPNEHSKTGGSFRIAFARCSPPTTNRTATNDEFEARSAELERANAEKQVEFDKKLAYAGCWWDEPSTIKFADGRSFRTAIRLFDGAAPALVDALGNVVKLPGGGIVLGAGRNARLGGVARA